MSQQPEPFTLRVPDEAIADLRERLARTRFPDQAPGEPWAYGTDVGYLRGLVDYWRDGFDWRAEEARLNAFPQFKVPLHGIDLHFLHVPGQGPDPLPAAALARLAGLGARVPRPDPAPDRPGPLRRRPGRRLHRRRPVAARLRPLVRARPARFGAEAIADCLRRPDDRRARLPALRRAGRRLGLVRHRAPRARPRRAAGRHPPQPPAGAPRPVDRHRARRAEERRYLDRARALAQGGDRLPVDPGHPPADAGLRPHRLAGRARGLDRREVPRLDRLRRRRRVRRSARTSCSANIALYWFTGAIGSSFWPYYARLHGPWPIPEGAIERADRLLRVPARDPAPAALGRRAHLHRHPALERDAAAAATSPRMEQPDALAQELREFFRPLRASL